MAGREGGGRRSQELILKPWLSGRISGVAVMERGAARVTIRSQSSVVFSFMCQVMMAEGWRRGDQPRRGDCEPRAPWGPDSLRKGLN